LRNQEIIKLIYDKDKNGELRKYARIYSDRVKKGNPSIKGFEKYQDILLLLINLSNEKYQIRQIDIETLRKYNIIPQKITEDKSFIVISDFHSYNYPLDKIKNYYLKEYDIIYILGDATDRGPDGLGTGGIKLLIEIMELSKKFPGKVIYIPGNHDELLLGYIRSMNKQDDYYSYDYIASLLRNGGTNTIKELNDLKQKNPRLFNELISWLGKQPLQRKNRYNGKDYVLGHAVYNQKLYDINPDYCLENYFREPEESELRRMANDVLWFRKNSKGYNPNEMPDADKIMIIGHTPEKKRAGKNLNLTDGRGRTIKVHCVDGGIAYRGKMLKYDGGESAIYTTLLNHNNTSKQNRKTTPTINPEIIFQHYILAKTLKDGKLGVHQIIFGSNPNELSSEECKSIINNNIPRINPHDEELNRSIYVKTVLLDHIIESQLERMQEQIQNKNYAIYEATQMLETFINGTTNRGYIERKGDNGLGNYNHITSKNFAREIAKIMGPKPMQDVLYAYGYTSVEEYIYNKILNNNKPFTNKGRN